MHPDHLLGLLESVAAGKASPEYVLRKLAWQPVEDVHSGDVASVAARIDHHRTLRLGFPEVVFCEGKTTEQVLWDLVWSGRLTNDTLAPDLVDIAPPVDDFPVALHQLDGPRPAIFDPHMIGPEPALLVGSRLFGKIAYRDPNRQVARYGDVRK